MASTDSDLPTILLPVNGEWLHAPTAAILHQFREIVLHRRMTRVAHLGQPVVRDPLGRDGKSIARHGIYDGQHGLLNNVRRVTTRRRYS
jgi:hypothetical protein